MIQFNYFN